MAEFPRYGIAEIDVLPLRSGLALEVEAERRRRQRIADLAIAMHTATRQSLSAS